MAFQEKNISLYRNPKYSPKIIYNMQTTCIDLSKLFLVLNIDFVPHDALKGIFLLSFHKPCARMHGYGHVGWIYKLHRFIFPHSLLEKNKRSCIPACLLGFIGTIRTYLTNVFFFSLILLWGLEKGFYIK